MKVDKNQPAYPHTKANSPNENFCGEGIPLRLEIATRILPVFLQAAIKTGQADAELLVKFSGGALELADALIEAHNRTCKEQT